MFRAKKQNLNSKVIFQIVFIKTKFYLSFLALDLFLHTNLGDESRLIMNLKINQNKL